MSDFTFTDLKVGGRLTAACEAVGSGHLNRAAGIFAEIADDLYREATEEGLLNDDISAEEDWSTPLPEKTLPALGKAEPQDLQMCSRNVHAFGEPDPVSGWRTCQICGTVNVAPPGGGPVGLGSGGR